MKSVKNVSKIKRKQLQKCMETVFYFPWLFTELELFQKPQTFLKVPPYTQGDVVFAEEKASKTISNRKQAAL